MVVTLQLFAILFLFHNASGIFLLPRSSHSPLNFRPSFYLCVCTQYIVFDIECSIKCDWIYLVLLYRNDKFSYFLFALFFPIAGLLIERQLTPAGHSLDTWMQYPVFHYFTIILKLSYFGDKLKGYILNLIHLTTRKTVDVDVHKPEWVIRGVTTGSSCLVFPFPLLDVRKMWNMDCVKKVIVAKSWGGTFSTLYSDHVVT